MLLAFLGVGSAGVAALLLYMVGGEKPARGPFLPPLRTLPVDGRETVEIDRDALARFAERYQLTAIPDLTRLPVEVARAIHAALEGVAADPDEAAAFGHLGRVLQSHRHPVEAAGCYGRAMALAPTAYEWAYHKGHAHAQVYQADAAIEAYQRAAELNPGYAPTFAALGELYLQSGDFDRAAGAFQKFITLRPQSNHGYLGLARIAFDKRQYETAARWLNEALARDPQDFRAHHLLGQTYQQLGRDEAARHHLGILKNLEKRVIVDDPLEQKMMSTNTTIGALKVRMRSAMGTGRAHEAIRLGREICRREPNDAHSRHNLALAYRQARQYEEALAQEEKAIALDPDYLAAHCSKAELLLLLRRSTEALELLDWIVARDPDSFNGHYYRGAALMLAGRKEAGVESFRRAVRLQADSVNAHLALARALYETGRPNEAIAEYRRVLELDPSNAQAIRQLRQRGPERLPATQPG